MYASTLEVREKDENIRELFFGAINNTVNETNRIYVLNGGYTYKSCNDTKIVLDD